MWFKVTSKNINNVEQVHYFNNVNHIVKDSLGQTINFKDDPRFHLFTSKKFTKPLKRIYKKSDVEHLRIQLGLNCNFSCKYCNQSACKDSYLKDKQISLPPESTIKNFIKLLNKNNIQALKLINLWGGEPFVYWKYIKILIPELLKLYPTVRICILSNGSLLNQEIINFLIKYRINLTISHDAQGFNAYRDDNDPLENPKIVKLLQQFIDASEESKQLWDSFSEEEKNLDVIKEKHKPFNFSINTVITPANLEIHKIPAYFYLKLGREVQFHFESIVKASKEVKQILGPFTEEQKRLVTNEIFSKACINSTNYKDNPFYSLRDRVSTIIDVFVNKIPSEYREIICDVASDRTLATDLQGNILACHGADAKNWTIGHLNTVNETINYKVKGWSERPHCPNCPFTAFCGGGCVIATDEDSQEMCEYLKIYHGALFAAAWFALVNGIISSIEPCPEMEE